MLIILLVILLSQMAFAQTDTDPVRRASITPSVITLQKGESAKFKVLINSAVWKPTVLSSAFIAENITWSVNGMVGGNNEFGTIDNSGLYKAPDKIPSPHEVQIIGKIDGVQNEQLFATIILDPKKPCYENVYQYSEEKEDSGYFSTPHGVAFDKLGNLIIADENEHHVMRFSREGEFLGFIGDGQGQEEGKFYRPRVVLLDESDGDIYISDQKEFGNRIQIFTHEGKFKKSFGEKGTDSGQFLRIHGMDFDEDGNLIVVDVDNSRITKLSHEGEYILTWGKEGIYGNELNEPHGLVIDPNDDVFLSSYYGTIKKFDTSGNYLFSFADANPPNGAVNIHSISGDRWGNVYSIVRVLEGEDTELGNQDYRSRDNIFNIEKFNNNGNFICGINLSNRGHSEDWVVVDENGYIYVIYSGEDSAGFEILAPK